MNSWCPCLQKALSYIDRFTLRQEVVNSRSRDQRIVAAIKPHQYLLVFFFNMFLVAAFVMVSICWSLPPVAMFPLAVKFITRSPVVPIFLNETVNSYTDVWPSLLVRVGWVDHKPATV